MRALGVRVFSVFSGSKKVFSSVKFRFSRMAKWIVKCSFIGENGPEICLGVPHCFGYNLALAQKAKGKRL